MPALVDGELRWTRDELARRAGAMAAALLRAGVTRGARVALLTGPSAGAIAAIHAVGRLGGVIVPLGVTLTRAELAVAGTVTDPQVVIHGAGLADAAAVLGRPLLALDEVLAGEQMRESESESGRRSEPGPESQPKSGSRPNLDSRSESESRSNSESGSSLEAVSDPEAGSTVKAGWQEPQSQARSPSPSRAFASAPPAPALPGAIVLTSGTTGGPKAVVLSATALLASADAWLAALPPATGWLLAVGLNHVAGLGVVWRAARAGVPLVILRRPDAAAIAAALASEPSPSHVSLVPTVLARLLDAAAGAPPPATLRAVPLGGGIIPPDLVTRAIAANWPVVPTYGLSEAGSGVTASPTAEAVHNPASAGRPLPGVEVRIAEPDDDGVGEIQVASPACFSAYLGDPATTRAAFTDDHWLRTGDLGRLDESGRLRVVDRRTDRIVRGGENVSPSEVEAVLLQHPAIADAAVVARRDAEFGQVAIAAVVQKPGVHGGAGAPTDDDLTRFCRARLAAFKVPAEFVRVDALPRTASGKLRRAELRARLEER